MAEKISFARRNDDGSETPLPGAVSLGPSLYEASPVSGTVLDWARKKGHVPDLSRVNGLNRRVPPGPHVEVVRTQGFNRGEDGALTHAVWPLNRMVTEEDYDLATTRAYAPIASGGVVAAVEAGNRPVKAKKE